MLLFPRFDTLTLSLMTEKDKIAFSQLKDKVGDSYALRLYDTLEDCVMEIEELKNELVTVVMSVTAGGREKFDTPEIKIKTGRKGRMRKDRYSAIVIANMIARTIHRELPPPVYGTIGQVVVPVSPSKQLPQGQMYMGHAWAENLNKNTCFAVRRN